MEGEYPYCFATPYLHLGWNLQIWATQYVTLPLCIKLKFTKGFASDLESLAFCFYFLQHKSLPWLDQTKQLVTKQEKELQSMKSELVTKMGTISATGECILSY